jgi:hypothetical protein
VAAGTLMTFCLPVVRVPAVARRDGTVQAGGWLPDFVRLGELERHVGDGVIESLAEAAVAGGRVPAPARRRLMSVPLVMRLTVAMTLMVRHEALSVRMGVGDRPSPCRRSGGVKLEAA